MEEYKEPVAWFVFMLGLITFGGFIVVMQRLASATPNALDDLKTDISKLKNIILSRNREDTAIYNDMLETLETVAKQVHDLKYQHDHPDKFSFGTDKTNELLGEINEKLIILGAKMDNLK